MIKVVRKTNIEEIMTPVPSVVSVDIIPTIKVGDSYILQESVKPSTLITYDEKGNPDVQIVDLGTQFDHRVTFLEFNLDQLL